MMQRFSEGDRVRVDIPDETDPDYELYHVTHGRVIEVLTHDADSVTGDTRDKHVYRVALDTAKKLISGSVTCVHHRWTCRIVIFHSLHRNWCG